VRVALSSCPFLITGDASPRTRLKEILKITVLRASVCIGWLFPLASEPCSRSLAEGPNLEERPGTPPNAKVHIDVVPIPR
jgi:hypothetical protein